MNSEFDIQQGDLLGKGSLAYRVRLTNLRFKVETFRRRRGLFGLSEEKLDWMGSEEFFLQQISSAGLAAPDRATARISAQAERLWLFNRTTARQRFSCHTAGHQWWS